MSLLYVGIDDTDVKGSEIGTGKLVRMLGPKLPEGAQMIGVLRHQLLKVPEIAYTTNNSPACAVISLADRNLKAKITEIARAHVIELASPGSDPGLCVAFEDEVGKEIIDFGLDCCRRVVTQDDARAVEGTTVLEGLGGTNDGIIGAIGSVGLTVHGWAGRFIEVNALKDVGSESTVAELEARGVRLISLDRDAPAALPEDKVVGVDRWHPVLVSSTPALLVNKVEEGRWETRPWTSRKKPHH
jgi:tRNA(Ile2) C34 agmatinyltransferase TiaS